MILTEAQDIPEWETPNKRWPLSVPMPAAFVTLN